MQKTHFYLLLSVLSVLFILAGLSLIAVRAQFRVLLKQQPLVEKVEAYIDRAALYEPVWFDGMERQVRITAYNPIAAQTNARPWETASGQKVRTQGIALSQDLLTNYGGGPFSMGDTIFVVVPFIVDDTMHPRNTKRADILLERKYAAMLWGIKAAWIVK